MIFRRNARDANSSFTTKAQRTDKREKENLSLFSLCLRAFVVNAVFYVIVLQLAARRLADLEFLEAVAERVARDAEQLGRPGLIAFGGVERLLDELFFDFFE